MNTSIVKAATTFRPQGPQACNTLLNTLFAVGNTLVDGYRTFDVGPNVTAVVERMRFEEAVA